MWEIDQQIANCLPHHVPEGCPVGHTFVPRQLRARLLTWAHTMPGTGHAGIYRTYKLLRIKYWWPNMLPDVQRFVLSCSMCTMSKVPCTFPAGKLLPLPTPSWFHVSVGFITDRPESQGHTVILIVSDQFSIDWSTSFLSVPFLQPLTLPNNFWACIPLLLYCRGHCKWSSMSYCKPYVWVPSSS